MDLQSFSRDPVISDLIASQNFKQALKNIDKKLKKSPNDLYLLTLKSAVLFCNGDVDESVKRLRDLLTRKIPAADVDIIVRLYDCACLLQASGYNIDAQVIESLWQNAIKGQPKQSDQADIAEEWASRAIRNRQWLHLAKAAQVLQRSHSQSAAKGRRYYFWQIVAHHFFSKLGQTTSDTRLLKLSDDLSVKMLERAIAQTPEDSDATSNKPGVWVATRSDIALAWIVFGCAGKSADFLSMLEQPKFKKTVGDLYDFQVKELYAMEKMRDFQRAWNTTHALLSAAISQSAQQALDCWVYWDQYLLHPERKLNNTTTSEETQRLIERAIDSNPRLRSPRKALLRYNYPTTAAGDNESDETSWSERFNKNSVQLCTNYFKRFRHQKFLIDDLLEFQGEITDEEFLEVHRQIHETVEASCPTAESPEEQLKWLIAETNSLAADYSLHIAILERLPKLWNRTGEEADETKRNEARIVLEAYICNCLRLYKASRLHTARLPPTDTDPGDEACVLAVKALVLLYEITMEQWPVVQACLLLEFLLSDSPHNARARQAEIELLQRLSLFSLSWKSYKTFNVKEILHESMSPLMFLRIASHHPFASGGLDAYEAMERPLRFYELAVSNIPQFIEMALDNDNYHQLIGLGRFREDLRCSSTRKMLVLERRRIARLTGKPYTRPDRAYEPPQEQVAYSQETPPTSIDHISPLAEKRLTLQYIRWLKLVDETFDLAYRALPMSPEDIAYFRQPVKHSHWSYNLYALEMQVLNLVQELRLLMAEIYSTAPEWSRVEHHLQDVNELLGRFTCLDSLKSSLMCIQSMPFMMSIVCYETIVELDTMRSLSKVADIVSGKVQGTSGRGGNIRVKALTKAIQTTANDRFAKVRDVVSQLKNRLVDVADADPGLVSVLLSGQTGEALVDLIGETYAKAVLGSFVESTQDTLGGILMVKPT